MVMVMSRHAVIFLLTFAFLFSSSVFAQEQGLQVDNTVGMLPPEQLGPPHPVAIEVITTSDGYDNFNIGVDFAEPHMSSNPANPLWYFNAFNTNGTHWTRDGHDWTTNNPVFPSQAGDPVTAYDSLGNLYYINMKSPITGAWVVKSTNGGQAWGSAVTAVNGNDKCWIAADQTGGPYSNYLYAVMSNQSVSQGNFWRSTNLGATWAQTHTQRLTLPSAMAAVGARIGPGTNIQGGCVYFVSTYGPTENSTYNFHRSTDGGATFDSMSTLTVAGYVGTLNSVGRLVINNARTRPYPFIAADNSFGPYRGRLYVVYASNDPPGNGNKPDIFLQYSTNQGGSWSTRVRVNDNASPTATNEWFPAIWCDKTTGRLYIKWYDMRNDPTNQRAWVYGTYTDDGGATFAPNQKISNADFVYPSPACSPNTNCYRGDYDAITSNRYTSMAVWTDFRNGNYGSFTGYLPDFAMLVSPSADTIGATGTTNILVKVPAVKLYTHVARFSAAVSPAANFTFSFPEGDSLTIFPDSITMGVTANGVANGTYTITVTGQGPNGTPIHKRNVTVVVQTISSFIAIQQPNGGEVWPIGAQRTIQWTSGGFAGNVNVQLSRNGGVSFGETLFASTANDGSETWTVTGPSTSSARVRISSVSDPSIADTSNLNFTIVQPSISVTMPNGGEAWSSGSLQTIQWTSSNLTGNVKIELSRNGGGSYETLFASTPNDGTQGWTVTEPASTQSLVRVSSLDIPSVTDVSNSPFAITSQFAFLIDLVLRDNGSETDTLEYGTAPGATDGIDPWLGEVELPPLPPAGAFDVRWQVAGTQGTRRDVRDTLGGSRSQAIYHGSMQAGTGGYPFVLLWDPAELPEGLFILRDAATGGNLFKLNMRVQDSLIVSNPAIQTFEIVYTKLNSVSSSMFGGWNIVSLPLTVDDPRKSEVFPTSVSGAFTFVGSGYVTHDTLRYGEGYWLKFGSTDTVTIFGSVRDVDTIDVFPGWNMIGSISHDVPTGSISQNPSGLVITPYYGYGQTGYEETDTILPMRGYWVKVSQAGQLILSGSSQWLLTGTRSKALNKSLQKSQ